MSTENPFMAIEQAARAQEFSERAAKSISRARSQILLATDAKSAFFGMLAMRLKACEDAKLTTANTDGRVIKYNPEWVAGLDDQEVIGFVAHEVLHCAMQHHARRGHRELGKWNVAADLACNGILKECGYTLPSTSAIPGEGEHKDLPRGLSAEEYYSKLPDEPGDGESPGGLGAGGAPGAGAGENPSPDPGGCGGVVDAGDAADCREAESDWKAAAAGAECAAKQRGDMPLGLSRAIEAAVHNTADWAEILRRFVNRSAKNDYTWSPPNRRLIHLGLILPSISSDTLGRVVIAVDTSGSIGRGELARFAAEVQSVLDGFDVELEILYHDVEVQARQVWHPSDGPLRMEPKGGGGTSHLPVFARVAEGDHPTCMICLTDGETEFPDAAPEWPVLWAMTGEIVAPFGESVRLPD